MAFLILPTQQKVQNTHSMNNLRLSHNKPIVLQALHSISQNDTIHAVVMDFFRAEMLIVPAQLNISNFLFYTSGAASLAAFFYFPTLHRKSNQKLQRSKYALTFSESCRFRPSICSTRLSRSSLERSKPYSMTYVSWTV
ncbi:UDP-glucuronosyl/UDP-glucosyltransferase [Parasponia andersonii]|uniref:UDP-glucuronosyl/UDP-glucosyltransferase n=1 Tax=Parasponia andersonii TaxID=3476 RepID=A0A2P5AWG1_PARAD|nr:UDP-glucuronosyl/UDP-glucosyltransferase [Parasponia andersonii]